MSEKQSQTDEIESQLNFKEHPFEAPRWELVAVGGHRMEDRFVEIEYRRLYFSKSPGSNTRDTDALEVKKMYFRNGDRVGTDIYREDMTDDGRVKNQHRADPVREWIKANFYADPEVLMTEDYESHVTEAEQ